MASSMVIDIVMRNSPTDFMDISDNVKGTKRLNRKNMLTCFFKNHAKCAVLIIFVELSWGKKSRVLGIEPPHTKSME